MRMRWTTWIGVTAVVAACVSAPVRERAYEDGGPDALELDSGPSKPPSRPPRASSDAGPRPPPITRTWDAASPAADSGASSGKAQPPGGGAGKGGSGAAGPGSGAAGPAPPASVRGSGDAGLGVDGARPAQSGDLLITELMVDPRAVPDTDGEWFELHNPGSAALAVEGCAVGDGSAQAQPLDHGTTVPAGGYVTVARSEGAGFEPSIIASLSLKNGADVIELHCGGTLIDRVEYDKALGFPVVAGVSMSLDADHLDGVSNDKASAWCRAVEPYSADLGTPGKPNPRCHSGDDAGTSD